MGKRQGNLLSKLLIQFLKFDHQASPPPIFTIPLIKNSPVEGNLTMPSK